MSTGKRHRIAAPPHASEVYGSVSDSQTLAAVEDSLGYHLEPTDTMESQWLSATRKIPLRDIADADLARLLERGVHIPLLLPMALTRLRANAQSGKPPEEDLITASARAVQLLRVGREKYARETAAVLGTLHRACWPDLSPPQRVAFTFLVCSALERLASCGQAQKP